jgi:hypothetical protein
MYDTNNKFIMNLKYKPNLLSLIENDESGRLYTIVEITEENKFCVGRWTYINEY